MKDVTFELTLSGKDFQLSYDDDFNHIENDIIDYCNRMHYDVDYIVSKIENWEFDVLLKCGISNNEMYIELKVIDYVDGLFKVDMDYLDKECYPFLPCLINNKNKK